MLLKKVGGCLREFGVSTDLFAWLHLVLLSNPPGVVLILRRTGIQIAESSIFQGAGTTLGLVQHALVQLLRWRSIQRRCRLQLLFHVSPLYLLFYYFLSPG